MTRYRYYYESFFSAGFVITSDQQESESYAEAVAVWPGLLNDVTQLRPGPNGEAGRTYLLVLYEDVVGGNNRAIAATGTTSAATPSEIRNMVAAGAPAQPPPAGGSLPPGSAPSGRFAAAVAVVGGLGLLWWVTRR